MSMLRSGVERQQMFIGRLNFASRPVRRRHFPSSRRSAAVEGGATGGYVALLQGFLAGNDVKWWEISNINNFGTSYGPANYYLREKS